MPPLAMGASRERVWIPRCTGCFEEFTDTLLCGDPFTQPGASHPALTRDDIVAPSEAMRRSVDCSGHVRDALRLLEKLAATSPRVLACMHGSVCEGNGAALLRELSLALASAT